MIIYDGEKDKYIAARDPIGIRPLFYGYLSEDSSIVFASEAKNLVGLVEKVFPFPPGFYYMDGKFIKYSDITSVKQYSGDDIETACKKIRSKLEMGIKKRLDSDAPLGFCSAEDWTVLLCAPFPPE